MRRARLHVPGITHHLIWRFVEHRWFISTSEHRAVYLRWLGRALEESDWRCLAYAVMSNHIHIAAVAGHDPLANWSRRVNLPFAQWINEQSGRIGPVFADRASDLAVAPSSVANVIGYIHNNPVRAKVVSDANDSDWTSHAAYMNVANQVRWLHVDEGLALAGHDRASFDSFVQGAPAHPERTRERAMRKAVRPYGQVNLATPFERQFPLVIRPFGRVRPSPRRVLDLVCAATGLTSEEIASRRRNRDLLEARVATIHCALAVGLTGADIASVLGITQQAVSWNARRQRPPKRLCESVYAQLAKEVREDVVCNRPPEGE